jgi:beta-glucanase (GH16 family)
LFASAQEYKLKWQDEFDNGTLNRNIWNIEVNGNGGGNQELQYYRQENVSVGIEPESGESCLIITAKKESYSGKTATSGRVNTGKNMSFTHGKLEVSVKFPKTASGLWPAVWALGADFPEVEWPYSGEIDIVEMGEHTGIVNGTQDKYFSGACHWGPLSGGNHPNYAIPRTNEYSLQDNFHLFTLIWDDNFVRMYLDLDKYPNVTPYYEMDIRETTSDKPGCYLHKPFHILLNLAVGGNFPQIWNINQVTALNAENNFEAKMYVNFIRLYQKGSSDDFYLKGESGLPAELQKQSQYKLYPNPVKSQVHISGPEIPSDVTILDLAGQKIITFENTAICNVSDLPKGNYLVKITDKKGEETTKKMIKQ